jgi:hypothetical protein
VEREWFVVPRLHPSLDSDGEGEHSHFRSQPGGQVVCAPFAQGGK